MASQPPQNTPAPSGPALPFSEEEKAAHVDMVELAVARDIYAKVVGVPDEVGADLPHAPLKERLTWKKFFAQAVTDGVDVVELDVNQASAIDWTGVPDSSGHLSGEDVKAVFPETGADLPHAPVESAFQRAARLASQEISRDFIDAPAVSADDPFETGKIETASAPTVTSGEMGADLPHAPINEFVTYTDTSSSISDADINAFLSEVAPDLVNGGKGPTSEQVGKDLPHAPVDAPFPLVEMAIRLAQTMPEMFNREIKSIVTFPELYDTPPTHADLKQTDKPEVGADLPEGHQTGITSGGLVTSFHPMSEGDMQLFLDEIDSIRAQSAKGASAVSLSGETALDTLRRQREEKAEVPVGATPPAPKSP